VKTIHSTFCAVDKAFFGVSLLRSASSKPEFCGPRKLYRQGKQADEAIRELFGGRIDGSVCDPNAMRAEYDACVPYAPAFPLGERVVTIPKGV